MDVHTLRAPVRAWRERAVGTSADKFELRKVPKVAFSSFSLIFRPGPWLSPSLVRNTEPQFLLNFLFFIQISWRCFRKSWWLLLLLLPKSNLIRQNNIQMNSKQQQPPKSKEKLLWCRLLWTYKCRELAHWLIFPITAWSSKKARKFFSAVFCLFVDQEARNKNNRWFEIKLKRDISFDKTNWLPDFCPMCHSTERHVENQAPGLLKGNEVLVWNENFKWFVSHGILVISSSWWWRDLDFISIWLNSGCGSSVSWESWKSPSTKVCSTLGRSTGW